MKYERFEDLPVWNAAVDLAVRVYAMTRDRFFAQPGDLRDQLRRAALSVSNNVAEGFERGSTAELLAFLYIARGSAGEVRSMLHFVDRALDADHLKSEISNPKSEIANPKSEISNLKSEISNLKSEISNLKSLAESCSRQIRAWAESLQNGEIQGQRHLNDRTRVAYDNQRRAAEFQRRLTQSLHEARPDIFPAPESDR